MIDRSAGRPTIVLRHKLRARSTSSYNTSHPGLRAAIVVVFALPAIQVVTRGSALPIPSPASSLPNLLAYRGIIIVAREGGGNRRRSAHVELRQAPPYRASATSTNTTTAAATNAAASAAGTTNTDITAATGAVAASLLFPPLGVNGRHVFCRGTNCDWLRGEKNHAGS